MTAGRPATSLAVVGLACRFPDADDPAALLDVVLTGRRCFRRLPPVRIDLADYYQPDMATLDSTYSTRAALIEGWRFDCAEFGIEPAAFAAADLTHWLALETTARALAAAGVPAGSGLDRDRIGVIIGNTLAGDTSRANALRLRWPYVRRVLTDAFATGDIPAGQVGELLRQAETGYLAPFPPMGADSLAGSMPGTIAGAISSYFGFRGGSHVVDSACSSSLQAVASACTALTAGEFDAVIAGGVDLSLDPLELVGLARARVLATTDVRIYDQNPTGFLPGEGCGLVVLMRTADARVAGLPVYAEIVGWGTSAGANPGEPQSSASSQLLAMQRAYERAAVDPADIQFIEGNGAGTLADDAAELTALGELRAGAATAAALGSVKANIGHAQSAAGAAGLIKTVLAVSAGVVPPASGVHNPHPLISGGDARIRLPEAAEEWEAGTRLAAVSTMGIGGSNVHIVLRHEPSSRARAERWLRSVPLRARLAGKAEPAPGQLPTGQQPLPFLLHAPDRFALAAVLSRVADIAGWLSDAEMQDLACMLGRDTASQGPTKVGLVATRQEQLAVLAREAVTMLPRLADGLIMARPGIFASNDADGRVTLLLSGLGASATEQASAANEVTAAVSQCLDTIRWLESMEVQATGVVGHGLGALAGLAWAGVLGETEVVDIAELRAQFLRKSGPGERSAGSGPGQRPAAERPGAGQSAARKQTRKENGPKHAARGRMDAEALRAAIGQRFRFGPPRRRLFSTATGTEVSSVAEAIDLICTGFAAADKLAEAIGAGAVGASLLLETGPGRQLASAAAEVSRVPAVSLQSGFTDPMSRARAAAALFAVGALGQPQPLFAGMAARPIDIWRDQVFISNPCQVPPQSQEVAPAAVADEPAAGEAPVSGAVAAESANVSAGAEPDVAVAGAEPISVSAGEDPTAVTPDAEQAEVTAEAAPTADKDAEPATVAAAEAAAVTDLAAAEAQVPDRRAGAADEDGISSLRNDLERRLPAHELIESAAAVVTPAEPPVSTESALDTPAADEPPPTPAPDRSAAASAVTDAAPVPTLDEAEQVTAGQPEYDFAADAIAVPASQHAGPVDGVRPWTRCFAEALRPARPPVVPDVNRTWRIHAAARSRMLTDLSALFTADSSASRTLAIIGDPADERSRLAAVQAARDAVSTGELVVFTTSAVFTGFFASVHAEHPSIGITVLRMQAGTRVPAVALQYANADPAVFRELVIGPGGSVSEAVRTELPLPTGGLCPVGPSDVVLVSRDSRGAGLVLAQVLALCGAAVAVIGRTGDNDDSELVAELEQLRSGGARIGYEVIDITNAASLTAAVERIEDRLGPVTAIGHGGGLDVLVPFQDLTDALVGRRLSDQAKTLDRLVSSVKAGQLKLIVTFGSVAGRYGMAGAGLAALTSGALADRADRLARSSAGCRALHIDMAALSKPGLGDRAGLADELGAADVAPVELGTASRLLLKIMTTPGIPANLAVHGRVGGLVPWPTPVVTSGQLVAAGLPAGGRFLRETEVHYPGIELVCAAQLSLASDPYLADYRIDGMPVLPPALAVEALAQAASVLAGRPVRLARYVTMESPVAIPSSGQADIRVCALREGGVITAVLRCADSSYRVNHARAEFSLGAGPDATAETADSSAGSAIRKLAASPPGLLDGEELYGPICFQSGRFRRIAFLPEVTARSGRAVASGTGERSWFAAGSELAGTGFLLGDPGLNDAVLQLLQACVPHRLVRPIGCQSVEFSGRDSDGAVEIRAVATGPSRPAAEPLLATALRSIRASVPAQSRTPAAATSAGPARLAAAKRPGAGTLAATASGMPAAAARLAAKVVAGRESDMSREELADMEIAEWPPVPRKSSKHWQPQHARPQHTSRGRQREQAGPAYSAFHTWEVVVEPARPPGPAGHQRQASDAVQADDAPQAGRAGSAGGSPPLSTTGREQGPVPDINPDQPQLWNVEAVDASGRVLVAWHGVELRDCGPLPRDAAWPPTLLSVFLERSAVELGLHGTLRVSVSCAQPGGERELRPAALAAAIPLQAPPADEGQPGGAGQPASLPYAADLPGVGSLAGFGLRLRAAVPVACGWTVVDGGHRQQPAASFATVYAQLRTELSESPDTLAARLDAIGACLGDAGAADDHIAIRRTTTDGWVLLELDGANIACAVVELSGVSEPVAIAVLTGGVAPFEPDGANGGRSAGSEATITARSIGISG
ncbi:MAG: SDR family NAD(P)-dependent oxidoreductase [Streptosporangiaceae bacterium]